MKISYVRSMFLLILILFMTVGCDKFHAKKLSGTYACKVHYLYWDMTSKNIDSTFYEDLEIKQEGKNVIVLGTSIPIDSLWKEKEYYEGYAHSYLKVLFKKDSVYISKSGGGLGGNATFIFEGLKK